METLAMTGETVDSVYYCDVLWQLHENSPQTFGTKELAVASQQSTILHLLFHQGIFNQKQHDCHPPATLIFFFSD
jgi:hypothetical protein